MIDMIKSMVSRSSRFSRGDRDSRGHRSLRTLAAALGMLTMLFVSACSGLGQASAVDVPQARDALKAAMEQWKSGGDLKSVEVSGTKVAAQDPEWAAGAKLIDYQILDEGKSEGVNLRIAVKLTLSNVNNDKDKGKGTGKPVEKKASYVVGTSPSVTVYRDVMRR
jgi:hypothetical protein